METIANLSDIDSLLAALLLLGMVAATFDWLAAFAIRTALPWKNAGPSQIPEAQR